MRAKTAIIALLPALLVSAGCDLEEFGEATRYQAEFKESHPLPPGGRLYLENFNGSIEIKGWDEPTAEIAGTKYASRESALDATRAHGAAVGAQRQHGGPVCDPGSQTRDLGAHPHLQWRHPGGGD
jgi:hypothetical protein